MSQAGKKFKRKSNLAQISRGLNDLEDLLSGFRHDRVQVLEQLAELQGVEPTPEVQRTRDAIDKNIANIDKSIARIERRQREAREVLSELEEPDSTP